MRVITRDRALCMRADVLRCGLLSDDGALYTMCVTELDRPRSCRFRHSRIMRARETDDEGRRSGGAPRPCVCVLRNALSRPSVPYAAPALRRYLGKSGRSNTPWHTSCENSVQGGILQ